MGKLRQKWLDQAPHWGQSPALVHHTVHLWIVTSQAPSGTRASPQTVPLLPAASPALPISQAPLSLVDFPAQNSMKLSPPEDRLYPGLNHPSPHCCEASAILISTLKTKRFTWRILIICPNHTASTWHSKHLVTMLPSKTKVSHY